MYDRQILQELIDVLTKILKRGYHANFRRLASELADNPLLPPLEYVTIKLTLARLGGPEKGMHLHGALAKWRELERHPGF